MIENLETVDRHQKANLIESKTNQYFGPNFALLKYRQIWSNCF